MGEVLFEKVSREVVTRNWLKKNFNESIAIQLFSWGMGDLKDESFLEKLRESWEVSSKELSADDRAWIENEVAFRKSEQNPYGGGERHDD